MSRSKFTVLEKLNLIEDYQQSGLPRAIYERQHGIGKDTLRSWLKKELNTLITTNVQHKETASLQMNTGMKPLRNRFNFLLFHLSI